MRARNAGNSIRASRAGARRMKWPTASQSGNPPPDMGGWLDENFFIRYAPFRR
jgi:hypothetical protein